MAYREGDYARVLRGPDAGKASVILRIDGDTCHLACALPSGSATRPFRRADLEPAVPASRPGPIPANERW